MSESASRRPLPWIALDKLVAAITDDNLHLATDWGHPVGEEVWWEAERTSSPQHRKVSPDRGDDVPGDGSRWAPAERTTEHPNADQQAGEADLLGDVSGEHHD